MLMLALYRCGRQTDALRAFRQARAHLVDVGAEPGPARASSNSRSCDTIRRSRPRHVALPSRPSRTRRGRDCARAIDRPPATFEPARTGQLVRGPGPSARRARRSGRRRAAGHANRDRWDRQDAARPADRSTGRRPIRRRGVAGGSSPACPTRAWCSVRSPTCGGCVPARALSRRCSPATCRTSSGWSCSTTANTFSTAPFTRRGTFSRGSGRLGAGHVPGVARDPW